MVLHIVKFVNGFPR
jgi:hypothetical protein